MSTFSSIIIYCRVHDKEKKSIPEYQYAIPNGNICFSYLLTFLSIYIFRKQNMTFYSESVDLSTVGTIENV